MAVTVETLEKLERRITLTLPAAAVNTEVEKRLKKLSRTVKADGFRPGKVPFSYVAQRYGASVHYEVVSDQLGEAFAKAASEAQLKVAGLPKLSQKDGGAEAELAFDATFEVYPEIKLGDLSAVEVERVSSEVTEQAIDKTVDILRKQRRTFAQRGAEAAAADDDRVTIDFEGKIDGEPFAGGKAEGFQFILGEGQMLEAFEKAVRGMKTGESKTFPLAFPEDYHGKDVAGKEADFLVTVKKIEAQNLPEVNEAFAKSLGIADATVEGLRADVRKNLEREVKFRVLAQNKAAAMDALVKVAELDLPKALVDEECERLAQQFRERLKSQGLKDADKMPLQNEMFTPQAERRVRLGLVVGDLVRTEQLQAKPEQLQKHIEELSQSYEKPADVMRWYLGDRNRMAEVEAIVIENNVTDFVLAKVKVSDKALPFDELMAQAQG
ncbi:trigger factor [Inhella gelatinilytica]|uniref:Trigger factor n=1 Tax=Inhella gelatinilytica TaxID=2795030 RepID=A0A931NDI2_9BURK|nr:trigger factor [Inhella gelatinilytica]MBH9553112.1 trigger factor [Inhella gelatinilytica]